MEEPLPYQPVQQTWFQRLQSIINLILAKVQQLLTGQQRTNAGIQEIEQHLAKLDLAALMEAIAALGAAVAQLGNAESAGFAGLNQQIATLQAEVEELLTAPVQQIAGCTATLNIDE